MQQSAIEAFSSLGLGFAFAGVLASGCEAALREPLRAAALKAGGLKALAWLPVILFSAPLLILRDIVGGRHRGFGHMPFVMLATIGACFWSLMSGRLVFDMARHILGA